MDSEGVDMEITLLVKSFAGLISLLAVLIFFLLYNPKTKEKKRKVIAAQKEEKRDANTSLPHLVSIIKNKVSTTEELKAALDLVLKHHGTIHPKLGLRPHPDFNIYGEILLRICRHPNTNKNLILDFDRGLEKKNEEYKKDINDFLTKGLNSRGM